VIVGWLCAGCGGRQVDLQHFATTKCGESVCHPDQAHAIIKENSEHVSSGAIGVGRGLGCPRSYAIQDAEPFHVDPLKLNAIDTGKAWHARMEWGSIDPGNCEVDVKGVIRDIAIAGRVDRLRPPDTIEDWKHGNDFSRKYCKEPKPAHVAQLSIYAELVAQCKGWRPSVGIIWHHFSGSGKDAVVPLKFALWPIEKALAYKPYNGEFTVFEHYQQASAFFEKYTTWKELPLAGVEMKFGDKSHCEYCFVRSICTEAATGAPF